MFIIRRVHGTSMHPTLKPGQLIMATRIVGRYKEGDIVIIRHSGMEKIKRISKIEDGRIFVVGDNRVASTDSRNFGWVDGADLRAKVFLKL